MFKKNRKLVIIIVLLSLFIGTIVFYSSSNSSKTSQLAIPSVPLYPGSTLIESKFIPDCPGVPAVCNVNSYTWKSGGTFRDVMAWYEQDQGKTGWNLSGGAGADDVNRYGKYSNGVDDYWLTIFLIDPNGTVGIEMRGPLDK